MRRAAAASLLVLIVLASVAYANSVEQIIAGYQAEGVTAARSEAGRMMWERAFDPTGKGDERKCTTCHGADLTKSGKHKRTGKMIEPMAPSVNAERFTDPAKVEKWFKRNCKWTMGRECTAQEKADFLAFLSQR